MNKRTIKEGGNNALIGKSTPTVDEVSNGIQAQASNEQLESAVSADVSTQPTASAIVSPTADDGNKGIRAEVSKASIESLERFEKITGLSRSESVDIALKTLATLPKDFVLGLIEAQMKARLAEIAKGF